MRTLLHVAEKMQKRPVSHNFESVGCSEKTAKEEGKKEKLKKRKKRTFSVPQIEQFRPSGPSSSGSSGREGASCPLYRRIGKRRRFQR
jgi:hypothetical protein